jgi:uncharacterized protein YbjT (DUF2867 family)
MEQLHILVTGGAGFIGSHLVDALLERGHRVRVLDALVSQVHSVTARRVILNAAAEFIQGDVCDPAAVRAALQDIDVSFSQSRRGWRRTVDVRNCSLRAGKRSWDIGAARGVDAKPKTYSQTDCGVVDVDLWRRLV